MSVEQRILALLGAVPFQRMEHAPITSGPDAAAARGTPLHIGGKSLVMKVDGDFALFVVSAARRIDGRLFRRNLGARRYRFATTAELLALTGLSPGCVPPFGRPLFDLPLHVDQSIADNTRIAFSAGSHTASIIMDTADYLQLAQPEAILAFSKP